jgi:hypothetical protein
LSGARPPHHPTVHRSIPLSTNCLRLNSKFPDLDSGEVSRERNTPLKHSIVSRARRPDTVPGEEEEPKKIRARQIGSLGRNPDSAVSGWNSAEKNGPVQILRAEEYFRQISGRKSLIFEGRLNAYSQYFQYRSIKSRRMLRLKIERFLAVSSPRRSFSLFSIYFLVLLQSSGIHVKLETMIFILLCLG